MAIFGQPDKTEPVSKSSGATIIAECARIVGEFNTNCSLHIDGKFDGNIKSNNVVTIGKSGYAKGNVSASNFIVSGIFEGNIDCNVVEILPGGIIKGKIVSEELIIEKKGFFEGESIKKKSDGVVGKVLPKEEKQIENKQ
jgi:cytoskeletal protein CcmA (bactofilin family)